MKEILNKRIDVCKDGDSRYLTLYIINDGEFVIKFKSELTKTEEISEPMVVSDLLHTEKQITEARLLRRMYVAIPNTVYDSDFPDVKKSTDNILKEFITIMCKDIPKMKESQTSIEKKDTTIKQEEPQQTPTQILQEQSQEQDLERYEEGKINWLDDIYWNDWKKVRGYTKKLWDNGQPYNGDLPKWFFLAHHRHQIVGRPQLIENVQKRIPLVRCVVKTIRGKKKDDDDEVIKKFFFFDERFDKRYDGSQVDAFALDFWMYRIITEEGKEYYIMTQEELPNEVCTFNGMLVELDDFAEMSKSMKIGSLSRIFFMKDYTPSIKILTPKAIVTYTRERKITEQNWLDLLAYHPKFDSYNRFPGDIEVFKSAHLLSSKVDDYPLHLGIMGPQGTRKSKGYIETVAYKFNDKPHIVEGANSRIKGLSPSFKEKPANLGYLVNCNRMGWVDEIGKMVEFELNKHQLNEGNVLGELNSLLDHSSREVVSGNDNSVNAEATAKFCFVLNPISGKNFIGSHVGSIDSTTMSRILWWVQDDDEQSFVKGREGVVRIPPTHKQAQELNMLINTNKKTNSRKKCWGGYLCVGGDMGNNVGNRDEFLTLFDTCQSFLSIIDDNKVLDLANTITQLAREPMKGVWEPRSEHHVKLLVDGLCKHRCLFKDYDEKFIAKQEDYDLAERILVRMVKGWDTFLGIKKDCIGSS